MSDIILQCHEVVKTFKEGPKEISVLKGVNLALPKGELACIVGNSGSGKTTLLHILGGLDLPSSGQVIMAGQDMARMNETQRGNLRNRHIGFVYQFHHLLAEFSALENVAIPLLMRRELPVAQAREQAEHFLTLVGLAERLKHKPSQLSGGERQRVALARALVTQPQCVLADEPTGNLDSHTARGMQDLFIELNERLQTTFLIVTHDLGLADRMQRIMRMEDGELLQPEPAEHS